MSAGGRGHRPRGLTRLVAAIVAAAALAGCATGPNANPKDPLEPLNRGVHTVNEQVDKYALKPVAQVYADYVPSPVRTAIGNVFSNMSDVYSAANNLLQGKPTRAAEDTMRVAINSVLGIGGLIDIATPAGLPKYKEDFGQTLGVWGVPSGPYLVLPLFGPSNVRDTVGMLVDRQLDPSAYIYPVWIRNTATGVRIVDGRAQLLGASNLIEAAALDRYAFLRDSYMQRRQYLIYDGNPPADKSEDGDETPAPSGPASPADGQSAEPAMPAAPAEGKPGVPADGKPASPADGTPAAPADGKPASEAQQQGTQPDQSLPVPPPNRLIGPGGTLRFGR
ncbi:phospholipid-binding lipoprotein MlaA [Cupriavidus sp. YR651]|uniref:MlaA family lipoprotein n=1 Tax=Cupriavidus sp. YR651 TaxID=1855315 RepID=UPI00088F3980|nr:VacJ family lipoprotein [Cupriavidus sp. YR651]SDD67767.1 phospholipid-binding lipoprotein MlaA [Cupriavidus sp. YR651]